jgi:hypothetical protein
VRLTALTEASHATLIILSAKRESIASDPSYLIGRLVSAKSGQIRITLRIINITSNFIGVDCEAHLLKLDVMQIVVSRSARRMRESAAISENNRLRCIILRKECFLKMDEKFCGRSVLVSAVVSCQLKHRFKS